MFAVVNMLQDGENMFLLIIRAEVNLLPIGIKTTVTATVITRGQGAANRSLDCCKYFISFTSPKSSQQPCQVQTITLPYAVWMRKIKHRNVK